MKLRRIAVIAGAALACAASTASAADGVLVVQKTTSGTSTMTTQVQVEKTRMRAEIGAGAEAQVVIFDGAKGVLYVISPARKSYIEMTKAQMQQMAGMMQGMMAQLDSLPAAQREQMRSMMASRGMAGPPARTTYKRNGSDKVARWACDKYDGFRGEQKVSEICTVAPAALGLTVADFAVTQQLTEFMRTGMPQMGDQVAFLGRPETDGFAGFPIRSSITTNGRTTVAEVSEISRQTFADALFAIPAGFTKQTMGGPGR